MSISERKIITKELETRCRSLMNRYPDFHSALIPALWLVQNEFSHVSTEAMGELADIFKIPPGHVESVLSFYTMLHNRPVGKHLIQVCRSISCMLNGSDELLAEIQNYLGIKAGETTSDGVFTLLTAECIGACGGAPVLQLDYDYHENMDWDKAKRLLERVRNETLSGTERNK